VKQWISSWVDGLGKKEQKEVSKKIIAVDSDSPNIDRGGCAEQLPIRTSYGTLFCVSTFSR
jgi:hypothetical protein